MTLYAESSAVAAWLLEQEHGEAVAPLLADATAIVAFRLLPHDVAGG